ncbi:amidohydrolase family protein [Nocardia sp. NPDC005366]|uniref:amidohydrolase family protein n=1 Tax=Nocardia sp. NPDC005366 TaxID=3156878 RepID=UPI0033BB26C3
MYELISVDDHIIEPPSVWVDRLPAKYKDIGPHVIDDGTREWWVYEDKRVDTMGLNAVAGKPFEEWNMDPVRFTDMIQGCWDPKQRAKDMEMDGVVGTVCFPTLPRFAGTLFLDFQDKELADLSVKAYNDWLIDEWCAAAPDLYIPMAITQLWDPEKAAAEVRRMAARGARCITFPETPAPLGLPSFFTDHWDPVFQACEETGLVINMHIGTSGSLASPAPDAPFHVLIMLAQASASIGMVGMLESPVLRKFPDLQMVFSEGGLGWIPALLERCDRMWERHRMWSGLDDLRPSDLFKRNVYGAFVDDQVGLELRHRVGVDRILWESDFPHVESVWPHSQEIAKRVAKDLPEDEVRKVFAENARKLYNWPAKVDAKVAVA